MTYRPGPETMIAEVVTPAIGVFDGCPRTDTRATHTVIATRELTTSRKKQIKRGK